METSLRYGGDFKALRIHAKERFPVDSKTHLQVQAELDTKFGSPTFFCAMLRHSYPDLLATLGVGLHFDKRERAQKIQYRIRGKKEFPITRDGLFRFTVKGLCDVDKEFKQRKSVAAAEFLWNILNFQKDQDVRLKFGYEVLEKVPYFQIRENNWTFNGDLKGRWNVRFDL